MLHLAKKAFYPSPPPFPLLHVDTTWKFREMFAFRDATAQRARASSCSCTSTRRRWRRASTRSRTARRVHTDVRKTAGAEAGARQVRLRRRLRRRAPRRGEVARQGAHLLVPLGAAPLGPEEAAPRAVAPLQRAQAARARASASSRCRTGPSSTSGSTSTCENIPIVPLYFAARAPGRRARRHADHGRRRPHAAASRARRRCCRRVRFRTLGCYPLTGAVESDADTLPAIIQEMLLDDAPPSGRAASIDHDQSRLDGEEEAGGLLLMAHVSDLIAARHRRLPRSRTSTRACCASSPAAASTTASRTLIGRLLYDSKLLFEDQLAALEADSQAGRHAGRRPRLRAAGRRPRRRARAGHHDRRRLPLLLHRQAQVHRRRHARATSSTRATWSPAPRPPTSPSS